MAQEDRPQEGRPFQRRNRSSSNHEEEKVGKQPKLFVTNLVDEITDDDLRTTFQSCGEITDVYIKKNEKGAFAFVTFSSLEEAEKGKEYCYCYLG